MWQDSQTDGGGCRIVWANGVAWVSRYSGCAQADVTAEVVGMFRFLGCENVEEWARHRNPYIYS